MAFRDALWFSDIDILRNAAGPKANPESSSSLVRLVSYIPAYDIARICMYTKRVISDSKLTFSILVRPEADCEQAKQACERLVQEPSSRTEFVDEDPIEQVWFICAKGNPNLQYRPLQTLVRDDEECVLTRLGQPTLQATHIMPNQRNNKRAEVGLGWTWIWLKAF